MYKKKNRIQESAKSLLDSDFVIIDTETTGLDDAAEILQIAAIDKNGTELLNTLVMPSNGIVPQDAVNIHGISYRDLLAAGAKPLRYGIGTKIVPLLKRTVAIYNASFDLRLLSQSFVKNGLVFEEPSHVCIMEMYAVYYGDWSSWHQSYRWQKLDAACKQLGIDTNGLGDAHSALGDCLRTLEVLKAMAEGK